MCSKDVFGLMVCFLGTCIYSFVVMLKDVCGRASTLFWEFDDLKLVFSCILQIALFRGLAQKLTVRLYV